MNPHIPRLRMFAGPNGSGKSSLKGVLPPHLLGVYLNADDIEAALRRDQRFDGSALSVQFSEAGLRSFFRDSTLLARTGESGLSEQLRVSDGCLYLPAECANSYVASVLADYARRELLRTMETVMSHPGKVELLWHAQSIGYRTYLYYVATDGPEINVSRVRLRVGQGGHPVPEEKTIKRVSRFASFVAGGHRMLEPRLHFRQLGGKLRAHVDRGGYQWD